MSHAGRAIFAAGALCLLSLSACGLPGKIVTAPLAVVHSGAAPRLLVTVAAGANANSPVAVDLVLVKNSKLQKLLAQVPVATWFQQRQQWELDNPKQLRVLSWEWTPGQEVAPIALELDGASQALVFADYPAPGLKPMAIDPTQGLKLTLLQDGYAVSPAQ